MGRISDFVIEQSETFITDSCSECNGQGTIIYEIERAHNFGRDVGYIDTTEMECERCNGAGTVHRACIHCNEPITANRGRNAFVCDDCSS